ncbi:MAG: M14 family zinc carboxypeptidase [Gemmatimonadota bacterium]
MLNRVTRIACGLTGLALLVAAPVQAQEPCCRSAGLELAERYRVEGLDERRFTHAEYWGALAGALRSDRIQVTRLGESVEGRAINAVTAGSGPTTVLLWSQMHGNESAATMSLADMIHWFGTAPESDSLRADLAERLTVVMIPMLNPDGAERFIRENAIGVDINRDARRTATPEGRILKSIRDSLQADFGFNLHDQGTHTVGDYGPLVAIALLAPAADEERSWGPVRQRARGVAAAIATALGHDLGARMARYDDAFSPRAFGDNMQAWGTSTVLIESGILPDDPQKQELRRLNIVALLSAFETIAHGRYEDDDTAAYDSLPMNREVDYSLLVLGGELVLKGATPIRADIAIHYDDSAARTGPRYGEIGDLEGVVALDTLDASGLFIHAEPGEGGLIRRGAPIAITVRQGPDPESELAWALGTDGPEPTIRP